MSSGDPAPKGTPPGGGRDEAFHPGELLDSDPLESPKARVDRELGELLGELRVVLPGVQVLFAFLLIVPFTDRFVELSGFQRGVYFATLALAAGASALLIAPSAYHRLWFRHPHKLQMLIDWNRLVMAGMSMLALATTGAVLLIASVLFGDITTVAIGLATLLMFVFAWYLLPLVRRPKLR